MTPDESKEAYKSKTVDDLRQLLTPKMMDRELFGTWLATGIQSLDGKTPLELIHEGQGEVILKAALKFEKEGSYL